MWFVFAEFDDVINRRAGRSGAGRDSKEKVFGLWAKRGIYLHIVQSKLFDKSSSAEDGNEVFDSLWIL